MAMPGYDGTRPPGPPNIQPQAPPVNKPPEPVDAPTVGDQAKALQQNEAQQLGYTGERKDESTFGGEQYQRDWDPGWERQLRNRLVKGGTITEAELDPKKLYDPKHRQWLNSMLRDWNANQGAKKEEGGGGDGEGETTTPEEPPMSTPESMPAEPVASGSREQYANINAQLSSMFPTRGGFSGQAEEPQGGLPPWMEQGGGQREGGGATSPATKEASNTQYGPEGGFVPPDVNKAGGGSTQRGTAGGTEGGGLGQPGEGGPIANPMPQVDPMTGEPMPETTNIYTRPDVENARGTPSFYQPMMYTGGM